MGHHWGMTWEVSLGWAKTRTYDKITTDKIGKAYSTTTVHHAFCTSWDDSIQGLLGCRILGAAMVRAADDAERDRWPGPAAVKEGCRDACARDWLKFHSWDETVHCCIPPQPQGTPIIGIPALG